MFSNVCRIYIYILLDVLVCSIAEYFYELGRILSSPTGSSKCGTKAIQITNILELARKIYKIPKDISV